MMEQDRSEFYIKDYRFIEGKWEFEDNYKIYHEFNLLSNVPSTIITWLRHNFDLNSYIEEIIDLLKTSILFGKHCRLLEEELLFTMCFMQDHSKVIIFKHLKVKVGTTGVEPKKKRRLSDLFQKIK
jgi:hypothetical protein